MNLGEADPSEKEDDPSDMDADACLAEIMVGRLPSDRAFFAQLNIVGLREIVVLKRAG